MPTVSIYVSNEDYDKFRALEKKSEFIHNALNPLPFKKIEKILEPMLAVPQVSKPIKDKIMDEVKKPLPYNREPITKAYTARRKK